MNKFIILLFCPITGNNIEIASQVYEVTLITDRYPAKAYNNTNSVKVVVKASTLKCFVS